MSVFDEPIISEYEKRAARISEKTQKVIALVAEQLADIRNELWGAPNYTVADAQQVVDLLGPRAPVIFQLAGTIATMLYQVLPELINENNVASPVSFTIVDGRVVLDPAAQYPTEGEVVEPTPDLPPMPEPPNIE